MLLKSNSFCICFETGFCLDMFNYNFTALPFFEVINHYLWFVLIEKAVEHESDNYTNCKWCYWYSHQRIDKRNGGVGNNRTSGDHRNYCITEIGQNTEKSPEDLRKLAVTQTPVKDHQLMLT